MPPRARPGTRIMGNDAEFRLGKAVVSDTDLKNAVEALLAGKSVSDGQLRA